MYWTAWVDGRSWLPPYLGPSIVTLVAWVVLAFQFIGLGMLAIRTVSRERTPREDLFTDFWVGLAITLAWLQVWSLWLPISWHALLPTLALAGIGWFATPRSLLAGLFGGGTLRAGLMGLIALGIWAAVTAQAPLDVYDAGTYHLSALRWASTYPVVPGLGNLNPALGLGSSLFLFIASVSVANVAGFHIAIGLLFVALIAELSVAATRRRGTWHSWLAWLLILPTLVFVGAAGVSTTMYDAGSFALALVMTRRLMLLLDCDQESMRDALVALSVIAALAFAAITIKIANAPFSAACVCLALALVLRKSKLASHHSIAALGIVAILAVMQLGPWLLRNVVLTGYPLYPLPVLAVPSDWAMPESAVRTYRDVLADFARVRGPGFQGASASFAWLGPWLVKSWRDLSMPVVVGLVGPLLLLMNRARLARQFNQRWLLLVALWIGVIAWFVSSPDPRYATALLWLVGAVPLAYFLAAGTGLPRTLVAAVFVAAVAMINGNSLIKLVLLPRAIVTGEFADIPDVPQVALSVFVTNSGLQVYGPPEHTDQVWDAPLPASAWQPDPDLRTRCPDSLKCGFTVQ